MICGDFNEMLDGDEHPNGIPTSSGTRDFQDLVRYCSFQDLGYQGPLFTWCNKRDDGLICKKLDHVLVNADWLDKFPRAYSVLDSGGCSDHLRCRIQFDSEESKGKKPFKFSNVLTHTPQYLPMVEKFWNQTDPLFVSTSTLFRLSKKLKNFKPRLRQLGKKTSV